MKRIESLLSREIGLNAASIGASAIEAAVKTRLRACELRQVSDYVERLAHSALERRALVEEIVVSETWFFRDEEVFKALGRHATQWLRVERPLRVLSLPCATGEEAYSVSICLLDVGLEPSRFAVRGVDVSERALQHARRGSYGKNSFRARAVAQHQGYFEAAQGAHRVSELVREAVTFMCGNVLDSSLFGAKSFDVVLCRNLLIYLDVPARARALENVSRWLTDEGVLFAGHAEAIELMDPRYQRLADTAPFAYVKHAKHRGEAAHQPAPERARAVRQRVSSSRGRSSSSKPTPAKSPLAAASLHGATELANGGKLLEARLLCEQVIQEQGASSEAYCLLGIIHNAAGERDSAIECLNKSLYLNQAQYEALVHLALLHEQRGELPAAANFRRRAERARRGEST